MLVGLGVGTPTWNFTSINLTADLFKGGIQIVDGFCASSLWFDCSSQQRRTTTLWSSGARPTAWVPAEQTILEVSLWDAQISWSPDRYASGTANITDATWPLATSQAPNKQITQLHRLSPRVVVLFFIYLLRVNNVNSITQAGFVSHKVGSNGVLSKVGTDRTVTMYKLYIMRWFVALGEIIVFLIHSKWL